MEAKHTPGPWMVNHGAKGALTTKKEDMKPFTLVQVRLEKGANCPPAQICDMNRGEYDQRTFATTMRAISLDEVEANAHLIAAAPDMLEALEKIHDSLHRVKNEGLRYICDVHPAGCEIRAAIAKAEGRGE